MNDKDTKKGEVVPREARDLTPFEEMDRLFHQLFSGGLMRPFDISRPAWMQMHGMENMPRVDVIDREDEVVVKAEIPGMDKEHIDVSVTNDAVTIKGEIREEKEEKGDFYRSEIRRSSFTRTVRLPCAVDGEQTKANFNNGVLEITMPKSEPVKKVAVEIE